MPSPICFVRHGPTGWNRANRLQGHRDIPLDDAGRIEVRGWRLPAGFEAAKARTSPAWRARETAALLGRADAVIEPRLIEMSWGQFEGRTVDELRAEEGTGFLELEARGLDFRAPDGESPRDVTVRLGAVLLELAQEPGPHLLFAHKGVIRAAMVLATGWPMLGKPPLNLRQDHAVVGQLHADGRLSDLALADLRKVAA